MFQSPVHPELGVRITRSLDLADDAPRVTFRNVLEQVRPTVFPVNLWTVTQVRRPAAVTLDASAARHPAEPSVWLGGKESAVSVTADRAEGPDAAVTWDLQNAERGKIGTFGRSLFATFDALRFTQRTAFDPRGMYPDASNLQVYAGEDYVELETLSPARHLQPGKSLEAEVVWELEPAP